MVKREEHLCWLHRRGGEKELINMGTNKTDLEHSNNKPVSTKRRWKIIDDDIFVYFGDTNII